ncbi:hypothetical protein ACFP81_05460 [Deinococcus lacus]|uniref:Flagellar protein FliT n=1 Tax=Deinococcus lacus TaxID=392561 RepID=A0ABW1YC21_9DEIO
MTVPHSVPLEEDLLALWRRYQSTLPAEFHPALRATLASAIDAARLCADQPGRDAYDVQQAAAEDLPALLSLYAESPRGDSEQRLLLEQLALIEQHMSRIVREHREAQAGALAAQSEYLRSKYGRQDEF